MHPHIESLNSIKVFPFGGQNLSLHHSFLDLIALGNIFDSKDKLKACFFKDSELKEINPIYESFKRTKEVLFRNNEEACEKLNTLKQTSIQEIEYIDLRNIDVERVEQITNQLLNYKIHTLKYDIIGIWESISNQALENISKINHQKLYQLIFKHLKVIIILNIEIDTNFSIKESYIIQIL